MASNEFLNTILHDVAEGTPFISGIIMESFVDFPMEN